MFQAIHRSMFDTNLHDAQVPTKTGATGTVKSKVPCEMNVWTKIDDNPLPLLTGTSGGQNEAALMRRDEVLSQGESIQYVVPWAACPTCGLSSATIGHVNLGTPCPKRQEAEAILMLLLEGLMQS